MSSIGLYIIIIMISYLLGSIPSAYLLGRIYGIDIRRTGSGNVGTMNTRATLGWKPAGLVLLLDLAKGMLAVYLAGIAGIDLMLAGSMAVLGHVCPLWLKFKGVRFGTGAGHSRSLPAKCGGFLAFYPDKLSLPETNRSEQHIVNYSHSDGFHHIVWVGFFLILLGLIIILKHLIVLKADLP